MVTAILSKTADADWLIAPSIRLALRATRDRTPDRYVLVEHGGRRLRCEIFFVNPEAFAFEDVRIWGELVLVGLGSTVYCVDLLSRSVQLYPLDDYFGSFHIEDGYCLIASGSRLLRIDRNGSLLWQSEQIAVDGITIATVEGDIIAGGAELDPPSGWRPYKLSLATGRVVED